MNGRRRAKLRERVGSGPFMDHYERTTPTMTSSLASETTAEVVPSFARDQWWVPEPSAVAGHATAVRDASTGEVLFQVCSEGLDLTSVVHHGRTVGQQELGKLTFHQRALKLKELAQYLNGHRERLYELSFSTGATKTDNMVDIDGGIGVLFTYSSKGPVSYTHLTLPTNREV